MSLYKRGNIWWVRFTAPNGQRVFRSAQTTNRRQAEEFELKLKEEYWRVHKLGQRPAYRWEQAVVRYLKEAEDKASIDKDITNFRWLDSRLRGVALRDIDRDRIERITQERRQEGASNATVNRMLALIRALLRKAEREWCWIDKAPKIRLLPEPNRRIRWLTREEADRLLMELPEHLRDMAAFTLATGLREANVVKLEWSQIDLAKRTAWIHPDQTKNRKAIAVPLNTDAVAILRRWVGRHKRYVFVYQGKPVTRCNNTAWRNALKRAGIEDFRWHDLRHTWASWHVQAGTPLHVLQELGGWSSYTMVQRYAHLGSEHLAQYAGNISGPRIVRTDTNLRQKGG